MDRKKARKVKAKVSRQAVTEARSETVGERSDEECKESSHLKSNDIPSDMSISQEGEEDNISRSSSNSSIVDEGLTNTETLQNHENNRGFTGIEKSQAAVVQEELEIPQRNLPAVNVPEKIVLCIDTSEDPDYVPFKLKNETMYPPLYMIKRIIEIFLYSKNIIDKRHEFALVVLHNDTVKWVRSFTSDRRILLKEIEKLSPSGQGKSFDLTELFDVIFDNISLPASVPDPTVNVPSFVPRVILLYSRSHCIPSFMHGTYAFACLSKCPYFTLDFLYIHEEPTDENKCEEIYFHLSKLDVHGFSYAFQVTRDTTKLHDNMAKLLAHPLQRRSQKEVIYKFEVT